jgi:ABC-type nickel/cobalt efflux system permease component RcnA
LHIARQLFCRRVAIALMMAAALAFVVQGMFVAASEAATGDSSHYYIGFVVEHALGEHHSHLVTHRHADGTIHRHAIDDDDGALAKHIKQPGLNMALVVCVVPCPSVPLISQIVAGRLTIESPGRLWVAELNGLRRPPRPPSIA